MPHFQQHARWWVLAGVVVMVVLACWPSTDNVSNEYVDSSLKRALVGFALARGLNGVISVAQGTEVAIQPAGVGVNFTPGEILDPVNDLVERFSWIMMLASSSLGIQKVLLSMSAWQGLLVLLVAVAGVVVVTHWVGNQPRLRLLAGRIFLFLLLLRFMMPAIAIGNEWVYRAFLDADYQQATTELEQAREAIGNINDQVRTERQEPAGLIDRAKDIYQQVMSGVDIDRRLQEYTRAAEKISENTVSLIVVFVMQTVVFPLLFLFILSGLLRRLTRW